MACVEEYVHRVAVWDVKFHFVFGRNFSSLSFKLSFPLPLNRRHLSCDDCLEDKTEDYQNCSVLYCVPQLYAVCTATISTHA